MFQVIHISVGPLDIAGGIREVVRQLLPVQQDCGIHPVIIGFCHEKSATGIDSRIEQHWLRPCRFQWLNHYRLYRKIVSVIRKSTLPTIVHAHELRASGEIAYKLRTKLNIPYVVSVHIDPAQEKRSPSKSALARRTKRQFVVREANGVVNVSDFIRSKTELLSPSQDSPGQIRATIYPSVAVPNLTNLLRPDKVKEPYVLALGRLVRLKSFDCLIRAWSQTAIKNRWKLVIAGEGEDMDKLKALSEKLHVEDSVYFPGRVEGETKWRWFRFAEMVAVSTYKIEESFCLTALEAIHAARPLVCFRGGGLNELLHDGVNGLAVTPGDEVALASALNHLAGNDSLRKKFSENSKNMGNAFSVETAAQKHIDLYTEIFHHCEVFGGSDGRHH
jgi:glycosyltransferase involved in cell wall biosynthesis